MTSAKTTSVKRSGSRGTRPAAKSPPAAAAALIADGSPQDFRARVRMYRQGLGDCFLLTLPRSGRDPFNMLIDCGALARTSEFMSGVVAHIRDTVRGPAAGGKARLDVVVATHEHKDHVSGFNQARDLFDNDFDIGAVWMSWTENLSEPEIRKIKETKKKAQKVLQAATQGPHMAAAPGPLQGVAALLGFSSDDDSVGARRVSEAMEYLKLRGKDAGDMRYLKPGGSPIELEGVDGVRAYVLGPPLDPSALKTSAVSEQMKRDDIVFHLSQTGSRGLDALESAWADPSSAIAKNCRPFAEDHCISRRGAGNRPARANPNFGRFMGSAAASYDDPKSSWRRIDDDWLSAFGQLALDLDNDTNNTSLVLAFEFTKTKEVLLFVADAQVGSWLSWAKVEFAVPGRAQPLPAHDLLRRAVFYKVGHHCSHNATLNLGGLALMTSEDLIAFIALDRATAKKAGPNGWEMPAPKLFTALTKAAAGRVVISDVGEALSQEAKSSGICATDTFIDYFLV